MSISKRRYYPDIPTNIGLMLGLFLNKYQDCYLPDKGSAFFGRTLFVFSQIVPELHFPHYMTHKYYLEQFTMITDLINNLYQKYSDHQLVDELIHIYAPIQLSIKNSIEQEQNGKLAILFAEFFVLLFRKRNSNYTNHFLVELFRKWDCHGKAWNYLQIQNLDITQPNLTSRLI